MPHPIPFKPMNIDDGVLVDRLLGIPGMLDREFRRHAYHHLPARAREQLPDHPAVRMELIGLVGILRDFRHLSAGEALLAGIRSLVDDHPAAAEVARTMADLGLIERPRG